MQLLVFDSLDHQLLDSLLYFVQFSPCDRCRRGALKDLEEYSQKPIMNRCALHLRVEICQGDGRCLVICVCVESRGAEALLKCHESGELAVQVYPR